MKTTLIIVILLVSVYLIIQLFAMTSRTRIEKYPFTVIQKFREFDAIKE